MAGSTSTATGVAPAATTADAVGTAVKAGTSTSSPGPTPAAVSASCSADAPDATPAACSAPSPRRELTFERLELLAEQVRALPGDALGDLRERAGEARPAAAHVDDRYHGCSR